MMKRFAFLLTALSSFSSFSMNVSFNYGVFMTPDKETYVETYLLFDGSELGFSILKDSSYQSNVEVTYIFEHQGKVAKFSKTVIHGPITKDTLHQISDFTDQQRFPLGIGSYDLLIKLKDLNNPADSVRTVQKVEVKLDPLRVSFSSIYMISRSEKTTKQSIYTRNGVNYYPRVSPFYPPAAKELFFYAELYGADEVLGKDTPYLINIDLVNPETDEVVDQYHMSKRKAAKPIEVIAQKINIEKLPTASYILRLEARDRENHLLTNRVIEIKRFNTQTSIDSIPDFDVKKTFVAKINEDSLREMCYCMRYMASQAEESYIIDRWKTEDEEQLRRFFYGFWYDRNPLDARTEWHRYYERIVHVQKEYRNATQHGCATDRGRIYLKYGKPNSMSIVKNEAHSYPYEIWHYYKIPEKSNAKFVFFDPKRTNDFELAHSNVIGEPRDNLWYTRLVAAPGGNQQTGEHNEEILTQERDNYSVGSRALDYWNNPR